MKGIFIGVAAAALMLGVAVASAAIPDSPGGTIHGCYKKDGNLRLIDPLSSKKDFSECKKDETAIDWNQSGVAGPAGPPGPAGPAGPPGAAWSPSYGIAQVIIDRGSGPVPWAVYSTTLGSPVGDDTGGVFRFTCNTTCTLTTAASGPTGTTVWPRLLIHKQPLGGGPSTYCEYLDGATNSTPFEGMGAPLTMGIGGSYDCPGGSGPSGTVSAYTVPAGYYDVWSSFKFQAAP